jgi:hypothetical protein
MLFIFLFVITIPSFSQEKDFRIFTFEGNFAYESDDELRSLDDMIYRKSAIVIASKDRIRCNNSIFIFETRIPVIDFSNFNEDEKGKIKEASNFFNDSLHKLFQTKNTKTILHKGFEYKLFNMKFKCLYLGKLEHSIRRNNKFLKRKINTYLIYDFLHISPLPHEPDRSDM